MRQYTQVYTDGKLLKQGSNQAIGAKEHIPDLWPISWWHLQK